MTRSSVAVSAFQRAVSCATATAGWNCATYREQGHGRQPVTARRHLEPAAVVAGRRSRRRSTMRICLANGTLSPMPPTTYLALISIIEYRTIVVYVYD